MVSNGQGSVRSQPEGIDCGTICQASFDSGTVVSLIATPASGFRFDSWSGACHGTGECQITLSSDAQVVATFLAQPPPPPGRFRLTVALSGSGTGHVTSDPAGIDCPSTCGADFDAGTDVALSASTGPDSQFKGWSGGCSGTAACILKVSGDVSVGAVFDQTVPPTDECAGVLPAQPGDPVVAQVTINGGSDKHCRAGLADGSGNLALPTDVHVDASGVPYLTSYFMFDRSGTRRGSTGGMTMTSVSQLSGFEGVEIIGQGNGSDLRAFAPDGTSTGQTARRSEIMSPTENPTDGIVVAVFSGGTLTGIEAYDHSTNLRWRAALPTSEAFVALGVDRAGNTLVLLDGSARYGDHKLAGIWIDASGNPGAEFEAYENQEGLSVGGAVLRPRVVSGLFLARQVSSFDYEPGTIHVSWLRQFDSLATAGSPPPDWLTSRPDTMVQMAHNGTAYALLDLPRATADCAQRIELLTPSGKSCGSLTFTVAAGACKTANLSEGYDGTVIQQLPFEFETQQPNSGTQTCTWRWWSGLLH